MAKAAAKEASGVRQVLRQTKTVAIGAVHPHPKNPRQGDVGAIVESIKANGVYRPVFAQVKHDNKKPSGDILAGSHSWTAQKQLGAKTIEVTFLDVTDDQAIRIMLADNATSNAATMNEAALASVLLEMQQTVASLSGTGYDGDALDDLLQKITPPTLDDLAKKYDKDKDAVDEALWPLMHLKLHPLVFARLRAALDAHLGSDSERMTLILDAAG